MQLDPSPVLLSLGGRQRELRFTLNSELIIRANCAADSLLWEKVGVTTDPETGEERPALDVNLQNLRTYLWAALQWDMRKSGQLLTLEEVGELLDTRESVVAALEALSRAIARYYGTSLGEK